MAQQDAEADGHTIPGRGLRNFGDEPGNEVRRWAQGLGGGPVGEEAFRRIAPP